jgi:hypothetical protein
VVAAKHPDPADRPAGIPRRPRRCPIDRVHKEGGSDEVTTIYLGEGPPEKYQTTGRIDSTDWRTGQPRTDEKVIMCTHIQVVYSGVNITSPGTCAQAGFS